jgi:RimJ/RimL family protein N-acetyltransferase
MIIAIGPRVALRRATPQDATRAHEWLTQSDLAPLWIGSPWFAERAIPSREQFDRLYPAWYFDGTRPFEGRALVLRSAALDLGMLVWHRVDLMRDLVELEIWLAGSEFARRGIASEALELASAWLQANLGVNRFLLRPSRRNVRALRCGRRAGFRETDFDPADMVSRLGLPASPYRDAVLLFRILPVSRAMPAVVDSELWVFIDSEFSSLESPQLLSFGAACADGRTFYAEIHTDGTAACSSFVVQTVLPLMEGCARPRQEVAQKFLDWLRECAGARPVRIVSDSGFDRWAVGALLGNEDLPDGMSWLRVPVAYSEMDRLAEELRLRRHHALDDALALRSAVVVESSAEQQRRQDRQPVALGPSVQRE